ncbi:hypothetical protein GCM10010954_29600 [Halobacillus andaensis]|uniref:Uncharacterized protein n=1 Tax=Halobacillus andaensis TaxID=1176239 RepID=A0A917B9E7_HALAA|nr:hypothetical protein GCM10010954_29600 [Halobacillus andaensis]
MGVRHFYSTSAVSGALGRAVGVGAAGSIAYGVYLDIKWEVAGWASNPPANKWVAFYRIGDKLISSIVTNAFSAGVSKKLKL